MRITESWRLQLEHSLNFNNIEDVDEDIKEEINKWIIGHKAYDFLGLPIVHIIV